MSAGSQVKIASFILFLFFIAGHSVTNKTKSVASICFTWVKFASVSFSQSTSCTIVSNTTAPPPPQKKRKNALNPLGAKQSFQLWYPGGQRLKVISFSWSWVNSPSKCFSNAQPTTIIASRDEKRCNASVQWTRLVHSRSLRLGDQHRKCHGWLLFFAVPDLQPGQRATVQPHTGKQRIAKR